VSPLINRAAFRNTGHWEDATAWNAAKRPFADTYPWRPILLGFRHVRLTLPRSASGFSVKIASSCRILAEDTRQRASVD
jgi:hypothetical protein